jgi:hypothetical protein
VPQRRTQSATSKHTNSDDDWAWVLHELANGKDPKKLTQSLASRRTDKPCALDYARRTVDLASARLWLIQGIRMDHIVTMLEVRRRREIPGELCSARAHEIAQTAQRMISERIYDLLIQRLQGERICRY